MYFILSLRGAKRLRGEAEANSELAVYKRELENWGRAFQNDSRLTSAEIGKAIGRSRRTVDSYIVDLRAAIQMELDFKISRMNYLGIPLVKYLELSAVHLPMRPLTLTTSVAIYLPQRKNSMRGISESKINLPF